MLYMLAGGLFLLIVRPYEHYLFLGEIHIERIYLIFTLIAFALYKRKKIKMDSIVVFYFMYLMALWVCAFVGINFDNSYIVVYSYTVGSLVFVLMLFTMHDEEGYIKITQAMMIVTAIYVLMSFREYLGGRFEYRMGMHRMLGYDITMGQSNSFATTIVLSYPTLWVLLKTDIIKKKIRYILYGYAPLSLLCLFLTGSRGGFVQCLAFVGLLFMKSKKKFLYIFLALLAFVVVWHAIPEEMQNRYYSLIDPSVAPDPERARESAMGRIEGLLHGIDVFKENIMFGVGPGNLIYTWGDEHRGFQAHNLIGQILSDTGLLGTIPFTLLFIICYFRANWIASMGSRLRELFRQQSEMENEAVVVDFVAKMGTATKQLIILLFLGGMSGHNMLRYHWVYVVYLAAVGSWIMHKYENIYRYMVTQGDAS
ncbi:O-antigen ligase family protein [Pseudodesulfovibrio karagichevae]|uniref:O-antigen ligase family protein n=1 Tax=Pseudodesulfovibrio karagichevae TaxID=3239305 RepID=A0ABV4K1X2_9BACT